MSNFNVLNKKTTRYTLLIACAAVLAGAFLVALPRPVYADKLTPPDVPDNIQVEAGNKVFLVGNATGTQNYICLPTSSGFAYSLFTPQATLFDDNHEQIITHFFSPNPFENSTIRATWQHSRDTSTVWAALVPDGSSNDPDFVESGAVPWLKLKEVGHQDGPAGGDKLSVTTFIQRVNTHGGVAPTTGCASPTDIGNKAFVPYTADYYFYK